MTERTANDVMMDKAITPAPLSLLHLDFQDLYARHLRRHSQLNINILHLAALFMLWYGIYGVMYWITGTPWVPIAMAGAYLLSLTPGLSFRVLAPTAGFLLILLATLILPAPYLPSILRICVYVLLIPAAYFLQNLSHKMFHLEHDMSDYKKKYPKGMNLWFVLLFYEVPTILNYMCYGRKSWVF